MATPEGLVQVRVRGDARVHWMRGGSGFTLCGYLASREPRIPHRGTICRRCVNEHHHPTATIEQGR